MRWCVSAYDGQTKASRLMLESSWQPLYLWVVRVVNRALV